MRRTHTPTVARSFRTSATTPSATTFFSDLVHYVRSGDFVTNMLAESTGIE